MSIVQRVQGAALGRIPTLQRTEALARELLAACVPGDFVECGVFAGVHPAIMAAVLAEKNNRVRRVHLFDSFAGIPEAGPNDDESITGLIGPGRGRLRSTGVSACSVQQVQRNMQGWGIDQSRLVYHVGWFQDTVPQAVRSGQFPIGIAMLRLDGDLYESTRVCLEHLHPLVHSGGAVIIDDYALTGCRKAVDEYLEKHGLSPMIIPIADGGGPAYYVKP